VKRRHWGLIDFLTLLPLLCLFAFRSPASADPGLLGPVDTNTADRFDWSTLLAGLELKPDSVLEPFNPEEVRDRRLLYHTDPDRPALREREAILPDPLNGRELVDRVLAQGPRQRLVAAQTATPASTPRAVELRHTAPNFVLPVESGV
jgi:hypothetical protein